MKQKYNITVDPEFESLIPALSDEEFNQLKENIIELGECHDPILTWNHIIVDGHNRWKIIQENPDIHYEVKEMIFFNRNEAMAWMIRNQLGRRNLTAFARTELSLKLKPLLAEEAKKRQGERNDLKDENIVQISAPSKVRDEIAKSANVSHDTVSKVEKIIEKAPEEVKEQLRRGEVSINKAYNEIREAEKPKPVTIVEPPKFTVDDLVREISANADTFINILRTTLAERNTLYVEADDRKKVYEVVNSISKRISEIETILM